jgi:hypothetical protein
MVYNTQNHWVSGLCASSGILNIRKHNVSETGSVSVLRLGGGGGRHLLCWASYNVLTSVTGGLVIEVSSF